MAIHSGKWKLIRVFFGGEAGKHDYKLYDLSKDFGGRINLAAAPPKHVKKLNRMNEDHLIDTDTVKPIPNPDFEPKIFRPELVGIRPEDCNQLNSYEKMETLNQDFKRIH